jgi:hypothetical protein
MARIAESLAAKKGPIFFDNFAADPTGVFTHLASHRREGQDHVAENRCRF